MKTEYTSYQMIINRNGVDQEIKIEGNVRYSIDVYHPEGHPPFSEKHVEEVADISAYDIDDEEIILSDVELLEAEEILGDKFLMG